MDKKIIIPIIVIGVVAIAIIVATNNKSSVIEPAAVNNDNSNQSAENIAPNNPTALIKEFAMTSFVEFVDGKPNPQFSLKEIVVNKGDLVRLKITVTSGRHDFKIDEFGIFADTPLNQETVVEFTTDKAGEFIYYCNQPGHRTAGHWGTLKVIE